MKSKLEVSVPTLRRKEDIMAWWNRLSKDQRRLAGEVVYKDVAAMPERLREVYEFALRRAREYPSLVIYAKHRRLDGTLTVWRSIKVLPLKDLADFKEIECLAAAWKLYPPEDRHANVDLRLHPALRIPTLQSIPQDSEDSL